MPGILASPGAGDMPGTARAIWRPQFEPTTAGDPGAAGGSDWYLGGTGAGWLGLADAAGRLGAGPRAAAGVRISGHGDRDGASGGAGSPPGLHRAAAWVGGDSDAGAGRAFADGADPDDRRSDRDDGSERAGAAEPRAFRRPRAGGDRRFADVAGRQRAVGVRLRRLPVDAVLDRFRGPDDRR